jgi:hypothetical protein
MRRASAGKGCTMRVIRTRIFVALASSAVVVSGFGLTAFAVSSTSQAAVTASQSAAQQCPKTTVIDYGTCT